MSCAGNGYLTGNMLVSFPFSDGQCLAWSTPDRNAAQAALERCFVDAGFHVASQTIPSNGWPSIGHFSVSGTTISFYVSACGSDMPISVSASSTPFPIVSKATPWGWFVVVLSSEGIRDFCASGFSPPATGISSPQWRDGAYWLSLCTRCVTKKPHGLSSIRVYDGVKPKNTGPHFVFTGDIAIKPGNNMRLLEPDEENGIELNAIPGAGLGVIPCTCEEGSKNEFMLMSRDGHVRFFNDTCYDLEPRIEGGIGYIKMHVKCTACCTCAMYEEIVNAKLSPLADVVRKARADLIGLLERYEESVAAFNLRIKRPVIEDVRMSLAGMPMGNKLGSQLDGTEISGKMNRCAFTAVVRNASYATLFVTVNALHGSNEIVEASASWADENGDPQSTTGDSDAALVGKTFEIRPGLSLLMTFVSVKGAMVSSVKTGGYSGSVSVSVRYLTPEGVSGSLGTLSKSVEV